MRRLRSRRVAGIAMILSLLLVAGCTVVRPWSKPWTKGRLSSFSHDDFGKILRRFVNQQGLVDYAAVKVYRDDLETYYKQLSFYSPDSNPGLFPSEAQQKAYWINAYNASVIKIVLHDYPIRSIADITTAVPSNFLIPNSGFYMGQRLILGGDTTSLYGLENQIINERYHDPRVHFALNGGVRGGPKLASEPYTASRLEEQLEKATKAFFAEDRNVRVDHEAKTVHLSSLLKWHERDFIDSMKRDDPEGEASLLAYAELNAPVEKSTDLAMAQEYDVEFIDFDWRLNDSNAGD